MPHMVIFRSTEGKPGYHQAETVDEAARFVEHLRNQEGVSEARIYRMQEVPIEFRAYYRVEVGSVPSNGEVPPPVAPAPVSVAPAPVSVAPAPVADDRPAVAEEPVVVEPMPGVASTGGTNRFGRFNRG